MAHLLNQTVESTFSLRDMSLRFAYEKMLLKLYSTYHAFADNSNTRILQLCDDMKYLLHQKPDAFSEKEALFIKEKEALAYYYQGYAAFEKRDYDTMKTAYDKAVGLMEKADMKEQYSLMCDMLITTFEYGISDGEKNMHLDYLHRAVSYAEKIQDAQSRQYFLTILHDDLMIWG